MGCGASRPAADPGSPGLETRSSSYHSNGSAKDHAVSVNVWGGGLTEGHDGHWGTTIHQKAAKTGDLHHVRMANGDAFQYERRSERGATGRSEVSQISQRGKDRAEVLLNRYGQDPRNLPGPGNTNSQHWTAGSVKQLEKERLVPSGSGAYWQSQIGKATNDIGRTLEREGKSWQANANNNGPLGPVDARFGQQERQPIGRLDSAAFANHAIPTGPDHSRGTSGGHGRG